MSFNDQIIDEFRANDGVTAMFGSDLVLLHTVGAKSGEPRVSPVVGLDEADGWIVVASAGGSPKSPAWYFNLVANPEISIETPAGTVAVIATEISDDEYDAVWASVIARAPGFASYVETAEGRVIPLVRLSRR